MFAYLRDGNKDGHNLPSQLFEQKNVWVNSEFMSWDTDYQLGTAIATAGWEFSKDTSPQISLALPWQLCRAPRKSWGRRLSFRKSWANLQNANSHPETSATAAMSLQFWDRTQKNRVWLFGTVHAPEPATGLRDQTRSCDARWSLCWGQIWPECKGDNCWSWHDAAVLFF